jgi:hypothetical protein
VLLSLYNSAARSSSGAEDCSSNTEFESAVLFLANVLLSMVTAHNLIIVNYFDYI